MPINAEQSAQLTMGFTYAAGAQSIGLVMYNAAQAQQGCQQIELAALGLVLADLAIAGAKALAG
jgi:hypothetical protein